jgi:hypothetical protein
LMIWIWVTLTKSMCQKLPKVRSTCRIWQSNQRDVRLNRIKKTHTVLNCKQCPTGETTHIMTVNRNHKVIRRAEATAKVDRSKKLNWLRKSSMRIITLIKQTVK